MRVPDTLRFWPAVRTNLEVVSPPRSLEVASPRVVLEMLGHANIRQTMDTYSHVLPNRQQHAAERIDAMLD
jgi:integrase